MIIRGQLRRLGDERGVEVIMPLGDKGRKESQIWQRLVRRIWGLKRCLAGVLEDIPRSSTAFVGFYLKL